MLPVKSLPISRSSPFVLSLEFCQVVHQFRFAGEAAEVEAEHFKCSLGRLASSPEVDEQARNHRTIALNGDAVGVVADQVRAAKELLEETEENLDCPSLLVDQGDDLSWYVQ